MDSEPYVDKYYGNFRDVCVYGDYATVFEYWWVKYDDAWGGARFGDAAFMLY